MKRIINIDRSVCFEVLKNQSNKPINKLFGSETPKPKIITIYLLKMPASVVAQTCNLSTHGTASGALQQAYGCPRLHIVSGHPGKAKQTKKPNTQQKHATHKWYSKCHFSSVKSSQK